MTLKKQMEQFWLLKADIEMMLAHIPMAYAYGVGAMTDLSGKGGIDTPNQKRCANDAKELNAQASALIAKIKQLEENK